MNFLYLIFTLSFTLLASDAHTIFLVGYSFNVAFLRPIYN